MNYISGFVSHIQPQTQAASDVAQGVERASRLVIESVKLGSPGRSKPIEELNEVANSYGMLRTFLGLATYERAKRFLTVLPISISPPEISIDPDGEIAFDWVADENMLSVSLNASGQLSFATGINGKISYGSAFFGAVLPGEISSVLDYFG